MKKQLLCVFSVLIMVSCGGNRKNEAESSLRVEEDTDLFGFDLEKGISEGALFTTFNELMDSMTYVPLETTQKALFPDLYTLSVIEGDMFISGGDLTGSIFRFDSSGRFVTQIIRQGRGPGEVILGRDWYGNPNLEQISFADILGHKILIVSTRSGERTEVPLKSILLGGHQTPLNDSTFVSVQTYPGADELNRYLFFFDRSGEMIHSVKRDDDKSEYVIPLREGEEGVGPYENYRLTSDYKGDAIFQDIFNDTLYRIANRREITPHLVFKRGALSPRMEDVSNPERKKRQVYFYSVVESGDHVFINYGYDGDIWYDVWSKRDSSLLLHTTAQNPYNTLYANRLYVPFSLPGGEVIDLHVAYADRDNIYCVMEAMYACKFMPDVTEDDNPVIVIAKLK